MTTQKQFRDQVILLAHEVPPDHPTAGELKDFTWSLEPRFDVHYLHEPPDYWAQQHEERLFALEQQRQAHELDWLREDYLPYPDKYPVILVQGADAFFYPWDGSKRISYACAQQIHHIPAIVGRPY